MIQEPIQDAERYAAYGELSKQDENIFLQVVRQYNERR